MLVGRMCFNMKTIKLYSDYHTDRLSMFNFLTQWGFVPKYQTAKWDNIHRTVWFYERSEELVYALNWYMTNRNVDIRFSYE